MIPFLPKSLQEPFDEEHLTRSKAWSLCLINLLAFPGMGTAMAGRRIGLAQAAIMLTGFGMVLGFMVVFFKAIFKVLLDPMMSEGEWKGLYKPYAWLAIAGLALCVISWIWALVSSISILRAAKAREARPPVIPFNQ
jgi:hypothetical protein